jgi:hypothetical protein
MDKKEHQLIKLAIGIYLIKQTAEQLHIENNQIQYCINQWCMFVSDTINSNFEDLVADGKHVCQHFKQTFINSKDFKIESNRIMKTLLWLNLLPGYTE